MKDPLLLCPPQLILRNLLAVTGGLAFRLCQHLNLLGCPNLLHPEEPHFTAAGDQVQTPGNADIRRYEIYQAVGSSVTFPAVNISRVTLYDFKIYGTIIVSYHVYGKVRAPYTQRVDFYSSNGTIIMRNLTKGDSGTYEQVVSMKSVAYIRLSVIEPVNKPTLRKVNETVHGRQCLVLLECRVLGPHPPNVTFLKDGEDITKNITRMDHSSCLSLDAWDPAFPGTYTCKLSNPLGAITSSEMKLQTSGLKKPRGMESGIMESRDMESGGMESGGMESGGMESGGITQEETSEGVRLLQLGENPRKEVEERESNCSVFMTEMEEPGEKTTLGNDQRWSTTEDIPNSPDPGHGSQEGPSTKELKVHGMASDCGRVSNG
ncbi:uncharacterized protein LOC142665262 [Rhinoderma darwinii]|uniref:uncharacterized protein LOC142665262 n=1 Tax=Rhinoderma darwinii TaxID=43563 RepID=UPI003F67643A